MEWLFKYHYPRGCLNGYKSTCSLSHFPRNVNFKAQVQIISQVAMKNWHSSEVSLWYQDAQREAGEQCFRDDLQGAWLPFHFSLNLTHVSVMIHGIRLVKFHLYNSLYIYMRVCIPLP